MCLCLYFYTHAVYFVYMEDSKNIKEVERNKTKTKEVVFVEQVENGFVCVGILFA